MDQSSLDDLLGIDVTPSREEIAQKEALKILRAWSIKPVKSKRSVTQAHEVVASFLLSGTSSQDLAYVFSHPKPLLASVKKITDEVVTKSLEDMPVYKKVVSQAKVILDGWYPQHYENRYTQPLGHILRCIKSALFAGVSVDDIITAMNLLGKTRQVITEPSLQYALSRVDKMKKYTSDAGSHAHEVDSVTENEIFAQRKVNFDENEVFSSGGFFDYEDDK